MHIHPHIYRLKLDKNRLDSSVTVFTILFQELILYCRKDSYTFLRYISYFMFFTVSDKKDIR